MLTSPLNLPAFLAANVWDFPLFPPRASTMAGRVDGIYFGLIALTAFFSVLICVLLWWFAIKYRVGSKANRNDPVSRSIKVEAVWVGVPFAISMVLFLWAAHDFYAIARVPPDAMDIFVVGKQWMWKAQHPSGRREINSLHVPIGQPVRLILTSQDVIHDVYIPAFRIKMDALPDRYTYEWFEATKLGEYHLFCAEYCGAEHSKMIGKVVVLTPGDYQAWLSGGKESDQAPPAGGPQGLFITKGCNTCHVPDSAMRAPQLEGLFNTQVVLANGDTVVADEQYIRQSILNPTAKVVKGYTPIMPTYAGQISAEDLNTLVQYVKELGKPGGIESAKTQALPATNESSGGGGNSGGSGSSGGGEGKQP